MGGVRDINFIDERDGDQYVGRILSSLDVLTPNFAGFTPSFACPIVMLQGDDGNLASMDQHVHFALTWCFGTIENLIHISITLGFGLASLLHHYQEANRFHCNVAMKGTQIVRPLPLSLSLVAQLSLIVELNRSVMFYFRGIQIKLRNDTMCNQQRFLPMSSYLHITWKSNAILWFSTYKY